MANQEGQLLKPVMDQACADIIQHMVISIRFKRDRAAEIPVLRAESYGNDRKYQHGKIRVFCFQFPAYIVRHGFCNDIVRPQRRLVAVLLQRSQGNQYNGLLLVDLLHF